MGPIELGPGSCGPTGVAGVAWVVSTGRCPIPAGGAGGVPPIYIHLIVMNKTDRIKK